MESRRGPLLGLAVAVSGAASWSLAFVPTASAPATHRSESVGAALGQGAGQPVLAEGSDAAWASVLAGAAAAGAAAGATRTAMRAARKRQSAAADSAPPPPPPPFDPSAQIGAFPGYFDPLGFSSNGTAKQFKRYRDLELKHGRIAMLAAVGCVVQHFIHRDVPVWKAYLPINPNGMGALSIFYGPEGFFQATGLLFSAALIEGWCIANQQKEAGNFGDPLGLNQYTPEMRTAELVNSRFAMISIMGIFAAELATGKDAVQQLGL